MVAAALHAATGVPEDQLRLVLCTLLCLPLGYAFRQIKDVTTRHIVSAVLGIAFGFYCFGPWQMINPFALALVSYLIVLFVPKQAPTIVFAFSFGYLSLSHIYRMVTDYKGWTMDYTSAQMVLALKVIQMANNVSDGRQKDESKLHAEEKEDRVSSLPKLIPYLGYMFHYACFLCGPNITFNQYDNFIKTKNVPSGVVGTAKKIVHGLVCYVVVIISGYFPVEFILQDGFLELSLLHKMVYGYLAAALYRFKYYFIWSLCEAACVANGLAWKPKSKDAPAKKKASGLLASIQEFLTCDEDSRGERWDNIKTVHVIGVEFAQAPKDITDNWNMTVGRFLKVYVYQRMVRPGKKPPGHAVYITQLVSAIWHGFYPGYYIFFISVSGAVTCARASRTAIRPIFTEKLKAFKPLYDFIGYLGTVIVCNHLGLAFIMLEASLGFQAYKRLYYFPFIATYATLALIKILDKPLLRQFRPRPVKAASPTSVDPSPK